MAELLLTSLLHNGIGVRWDREIDRFVLVTAGPDRSLWGRSGLLWSRELLTTEHAVAELELLGFGVAPGADWGDDMRRLERIEHDARTTRPPPLVVGYQPARTIAVAGPDGSLVEQLPGSFDWSRMDRARQAAGAVLHAGGPVTFPSADLTGPTARCAERLAQYLLGRTEFAVSMWAAQDWGRAVTDDSGPFGPSDPTELPATLCQHVDERSSEVAVSELVRRSSRARPQQRRPKLRRARQRRARGTIR